MLANYAVSIHANPLNISNSGKNFTLELNSFDIPAAIEALQNSGLTLEDLRSKSCCYLYTNTPETLLIYITASIFAGRWLDFYLDGTLVDAIQVETTASKLIPTASPVDRESEYLVYSEKLLSPPPNSLIFENLVAENIQLISFTKNLVYVLNSKSLLENILNVISISTLRNRNGFSRMPNLSTKMEISEDNTNLENLRRTVQDYRKSKKLGNREAVINIFEITDQRVKYLEKASLAPIDIVLEKLGAKQNKDTFMYHCPRPNRHSNGDRTPSTKVSDGKVQCMRCDSEKVDALRIVMDTLALSPDDAAEWILS